MLDYIKEPIQELMSQAPVLSQIISTLIIYTIAKTVHSNIELHTSHLVKKHKRIKLPPKIKESIKTVDEEKLAQKAMSDSVIEFYNVIKENLSPEELAILNKNIDTLKIKESPISKISTKFKQMGFDLTTLVKTIKGGHYNCLTNSVTIDETSIKISIFHELMHMASSVKTPEGIYSGFSQKIFTDEIGSGINEGYTQLLTERLFPDSVQSEFVVYPFEIVAAKLVEELIGEEKMRHLYFGANLQGLVQELSQFASVEEVKMFIANMDTINKHLYFRNPLVLEEKLFVQNAMYGVNEFLMKAHQKRIDSIEGLTEEQKIEMLEEVKNKIRNNKVYEHWKFKPFNEQSTEKKIQ